MTWKKKQINISNKLNYVKLTYKHYQINTNIPFISSFKNHAYKIQVRFMEAHLVKIMTIELHCKSILIQLYQIFGPVVYFLSSLNNSFSSMLVIIFSNMNYFCFNHTNTLFIHTRNYFSVVIQIIFLMCIENYFFIGPIIIFHGIREFVFWPTMHCGPCSWSGLVRVFDFLG